MRDTKVSYVERVRELLRRELSVEELDLLTSDLEDQLTDLESAEVEVQLGSPEEFVETYRVSAGLDLEDQRSSRIIHGITGWLDARRDSPLGRVWLKYQEAWWLLRGWVMVLAFGLVYTPTPPTFRPFPIPIVDELPTTSFAVLVGLTVGSLLLARTAKWFPGRVANVLVSAFSAYAAFVAAVNT